MAIYFKIECGLIIFIFLTNYLIVDLNAQIDSINNQLNTTNVTTIDEKVFGFNKIKDIADEKIIDNDLTSTISSITSTYSSNLTPQSITPSAPLTIPLNKSHATHFKTWLDSKSNELYELSMNFSGYKLLNETYNTHLIKDAKFPWINFTSMIINISNTISEVLYNKTLIVKNLSDFVEKTYNDYRNESEKVKDSINFVYYDSKSPKTFCDVDESYKLKLAEKNSKKKVPTTVQTTTKPTTTTISNTDSSTPASMSDLSIAFTTKISKKAKRSSDNSDELNPSPNILIDEELQWVNSISNLFI